ncbi:hypothetical protein CERZMDRAFT_81581 [Cercospora zeae-maydis SCOH1-5]|uniref:Uncharacterized protein n=1 Tax=Cercospora zeae-maydis SCOH1-5 TaxID=717836 RepID=A0A6A6FT54_9PEZI|nr:hypothetical protein CERZMDRAFT_81581 [Cercospora zeae-maydis SCOH1-5]
MACELETSPFADSSFNDSWLKTENGNNDLDAIRAYNANFEQQNSGAANFSQTFGNEAVAQSSSEPAYNFSPTNTDFDQNIAAPPVYEAYPAAFTNNHSFSPYLQSVENSNGAKHPTSSLRHEHYGHRRSVSEPPGMPNQPAILFHRDEHYLGSPIPHSKVKTLKSQPSHKASRSQPYPTVSRKSARQQMQGHPHPHALQQQQQHQGFRPSVHRSQTQPARQYGPTSTPMLSPQPYMGRSPPNPAQHQNSYMQPQHTASPLPQVPMSQEQNPFMQSTSRVCTPTPIDPALGTPSPPGSKTRSINLPQSTTLNIQMTVDELRVMIFETVKEAMASSKVNGRVADSNGDSVQSILQTQHAEYQEFAAFDSAGEGNGSRAVQIEETEDVDALLGVMHVEKTD